MKKTADLLRTEIAHGKWLSNHDPIRQWGWGTPAGRLRAKRRVALIVRAGGLGPGRRVLEIGCGTGMFTEWLAQTGAEILAVDLSADLLALARERRLPPGRVVFLERPFEECGGLGPFDAIVGSSVLHHLECPAALTRIFEMLRPGGRLGFCEPNRLNPQVWFCLKFRRYFPQYSPEEGAFVRWNLARQLAAAGFSDIGITAFDWLHPAVPRPLIRAVKAAEWVCERTPGIREFAGSLCVAAGKPG